MAVDGWSRPRWVSVLVVHWMQESAINNSIADLSRYVRTCVVDVGILGAAL